MFSQFILFQISYVCVATNELLELLGEITPTKKVLKKTMKKRYASLRQGLGAEKNRDSKTSDTLTSVRSIDASEKGTKKEVVRKPEPLARSKTSTVSAKSSFFGISSQVLMQQSEWVNQDAVPLLVMPLIEPSTMVLVSEEGGNMKLMKKNMKNYYTLPPLLSLNCAIHNMNYDMCVTAQKRCIAHLSRLRTSLPTSSYEVLNPIEPSQHSMQIARHIPILKIKSAKIIKSESHLLMDKVKAAGFVGKMTTSASTFYNPYAKKHNEATGKNIITLIAQGEERTIVVEVDNNLSVPLIIPSCQLAFKKPTSIDIEAPSLSIIVPPRTKAFCVHFPFIVVSADETSKSTIPNTNDEGDISSLYSFAITGLHVAVNNRSIYVPFPKESNSSNLTNLLSNRQIPEPASTYQRRSKKKEEEKQFSVDLEALPAQPNLLVSFSTAPTPLEDAATVPVHLSDGEIYTIPPFRLENDLGLGSGTMERLQVVAVGLPGLPEEILFDTDELAKALEEEEDRFSDTDSDESFDELMESDGVSIILKNYDYNFLNTYSNNLIFVYV